MRWKPDRRGFTITDLLAVVLVAAALLAVAVPGLAGAKGDSGVQQSMHNLVALGVAHVLYAADWDGRQVTWVRDDLGAFNGNVNWYNQNVPGCEYHSGLPDCHPPIIAGFNCESGPWGYYVTQSNSVMFQPMNFSNSPGACQICVGWGTWRIPNARPLHAYLNGRYHDPVYYAPNDTVVQEALQGCLGTPCEFNSSQDCNPGWSSYGMSPAAMFHHDVFRSNAAGGWQAPWQLDHGYEAPGLFQAAYANLKTLMIEHDWIQGPPAECNPAYEFCEPYRFNQGIDSAPVTLFYDTSVRLLPNGEVFAADQQVLAQTGGVDGLWHRGTPFGADGYFISAGFDGTPLSHHVLTTDGILGRDTLGGAPLSIPAKRAVRAAAAPIQPPGPWLVPPAWREHALFTLPMEADQ